MFGSNQGRYGVPPTVVDDADLPSVTLNGRRFHVHVAGGNERPTLIVVHGGPGGDFNYLMPLMPLSVKAGVQLVFYDQRGTGLSERVPSDELSLETSLEDLHAMVLHYGRHRPVRLLGHSWGAMLVMAYLARHPRRVSHAIAVEPGMLNQAAAIEFVRRMKASQSWRDGLRLAGHIVSSFKVPVIDGHERPDYAMTQVLNDTRPGGPYQCPGESMPPNAFRRAGYAAFAAMLKPVFSNPRSFCVDLTEGVLDYRGRLLMISSSCSIIGHEFQTQWHLPWMPSQTQHRLAAGMGHNMLTLQPAWSLETLAEFLT